MLADDIRAHPGEAAARLVGVEPGLRIDGEAPQDLGDRDGVPVVGARGTVCRRTRLVGGRGRAAGPAARPR